MGPTAADVGAISRALAARRQSLARLVHNLAVVTQAASEDHRLTAVVVAGEETLHALASQDVPLRASLAQLPSTLAVTRSTLTDLQPFAQQLGPTLSALAPAVGRLPATLRSLEPFAAQATTALRDEIRPLIGDAQPLVHALAPVVSKLYSATPYLSLSFQVLEYLVNELAYNPPGNDEGFLFWLSWFVHNFNSVVSSGDANGGIGRAAPLATCYGLQSIPALRPLFGALKVCPQ
jgi:phospholipid/cholesterol/gamma-HCH transport system substrate-binding protein